MSKVQLHAAERFACPSCGLQRRRCSPICLGAPPRHSGPSTPSPSIKPFASSGPGYPEPPRNTGAETRLWQGSLPQTGFFSTHELSGGSSLSQLRAALGSVSHLSSARTPFPLAPHHRPLPEAGGPRAPGPACALAAACLHCSRVPSLPGTMDSPIPRNQDWHSTHAPVLLKTFHQQLEAPLLSARREQRSHKNLLGAAGVAARAGPQRSSPSSSSVRLQVRGADAAPWQRAQALAGPGRLAPTQRSALRPG